MTNTATEILQQHWPHQPSVVLVLGTGLGQLARRIQVEAVIPFEDLPGFPPATAPAHRGRIVCGHMQGVPLIVLDGRCHLYEGYSFDDVSWPIRAIHACGAELLVISNASGGLNPRYAPGDIMVIEDHISLLGRGAGGLSPAMAAGRPVRESSSPYDDNLIRQVMSHARQANFTAHRGIYVAVTGPNFETRAEYRFLRAIGGDAVGMSTVPEVIEAKELGMRVLGLSVIANVARPDAPRAVEESEVINVVERAEPHVRQLVNALMASIAK